MEMLIEETPKNNVAFMYYSKHLYSVITAGYTIKKSHKLTKGGFDFDRGRPIFYKGFLKYTYSTGKRIEDWAPKLNQRRFNDDSTLGPDQWIHRFGLN